MILEYSTETSDAVLNFLAGMMDGGSIELRSDERVLAVLKLSDPAAMPAVDGRIEFNEIHEEDAALAQGVATSARILAADGSEVFTCDVGEDDSEAVIKLNTTKIYRNGLVRLRSFQLIMG